MNGEMLWFNEAKGFGYILTEEGERIRVYESGFLPGHLPVGRCARLPVNLAASKHDGERVAVEVSAAAAQNHGRARLRHGRGRTM